MSECSKTYKLRLPALQIRQSDNRLIYTFGVDGKLISRFATVSRVRRENKALNGYQRPEVLSHVSAIKSYIESSNPMVPNAIVVAFNETVSFEPDDGGLSADNGSFVQSGHLVVPVDEDLPDEKKPGWIVDGQQRCAAVREADLESFPLCINAFIASEDEQRTQFILVNSTKPLPKGLIYELLPSTNGHLPTALVKKRLPSLLLQHLNYDEDSPFWQLIQTPTTPEGVIKDNSILRMVDNSLTDGCLYYCYSEAGDTDVPRMLTTLNNYWSAVKETFAFAWGRSPRRSRLMHGVGILSMGFLMDAITDRYVTKNRWPDTTDYLSELAPLKDSCSWTEGFWQFELSSTRRWNELQNTSHDIRLLTSYLLSIYTSCSPYDLVYRNIV